MPQPSVSPRALTIKSLAKIPIEAAHGGTGQRQLILTQADPVSSHLEALTKGFLGPAGVFDWHDHTVDEFMIVTSGTGTVAHETSEGTVELPYEAGSVVYFPVGVRHRIASAPMEKSEFFFIRLDS